jgi:aspartate kinase
MVPRSSAHILKFGGAALADGEGVRRVAGIIAERWQNTPNERTVVVVSAHRGVTDLLGAAAWAASRGEVDPSGVRVRHRALLRELGLPGDLLDRYWREWGQFLEGLAHAGPLSAAQLDLALSFGERLSARIVARVCTDFGLPAVPVDAWDLGLVSDSRHGSARPLEGSAEALRRGLDGIVGIPVVTGFLAKDSSGNLTTLGRNGSDLTASLIASALGAEQIQFWKTVGGIMTADPDLVPDARSLASVTYGEAAEFAFHGAQVLHPEAIMPDLRDSTRVSVRDVRDPNAPGTLLTNSVEGNPVGPVGVAARPNLLRIDVDVPSPNLRPERVAALFEVLGRCGVEASLVDAEGDQISAFVESGPGVPAALDELGDMTQVYGDLASVALIGHGVGEDLALGRGALEAFDLAGIEVQRAFLGTRRSSQAFAVAAGDLVRAARALHGFVLSHPRWSGTERRH